LKAATDQASAGVRAELEEAKAQVREGADTVRAGFASAAEQAKAQAAEIASQGKQRAYDLAEDQKQLGAEGIKSVARAVRTAANELEDTAPGVARYVQDAASAIDRVSGDLKAKSVDDLIGTVEHFARSQPVAFFGGAVLAGFVLARFIKSSADRRATATASGVGDPGIGRSHPMHLDTSQITGGRTSPNAARTGVGRDGGGRDRISEGSRPTSGPASVSDTKSGGSAMSRGVGSAGDMTGDRSTVTRGPAPSSSPLATGPRGRS
jgi:hypothetical protein